QLLARPLPNAIRTQRAPGRGSGSKDHVAGVGEVEVNGLGIRSPVKDATRVRLGPQIGNRVLVGDERHTPAIVQAEARGAAQKLIDSAVKVLLGEHDGTKLRQGATCGIGRAEMNGRDESGAYRHEHPTAT